MKLRIIAGELGGRTIEAPPGRGTRPTRAEVRESWFNALGEAVCQARVLDLFAGSGALGIEALSRGAESAHFIESNQAATVALRNNLNTLDLWERATVERRDVFRYLEGLPTTTRFDLALADPPYRTDAAVRLLRRFEDHAFADLLCLEHAPGILGAAVDTVWQRRYGDTELTFLEPR